jgi:simple sugar transport system substrate-binding protein
MFKRNIAWTVVALLAMFSMMLTSCQGAKTDEEFIFGVILVGPYNDHGWSEAHYQAGKYVEEHVPNTKMIYLDKLNASDRPGTTLEQAVEDMINQGAQMILTTSDDFAADTDVVAAKYPDILSSTIRRPRAHGARLQERHQLYVQEEYMKAVAGCAASLKTQTAGWPTWAP